MFKAALSQAPARRFFAAHALAVQTGDGEFANSAVLPDAKLQFLGDVFATPASLPLHNVFSIGDAILLIGVFVLVHSACGSRVIPRRFRFTAVRSATA